MPATKKIYALGLTKIEYARKWRHDNLEKCRGYARASSRKNYNPLKQHFLRYFILEEYGFKCVCCGEGRHEFLSIDHVFNDGAKDRGTGNRNTYYQVNKLGLPRDRFQILCHNCNFAKGIYGECPHRRTPNE